MCKIYPNHPCNYLHSTDNQPEMDNASGSRVLTLVLIAVLLCVLVGLVLVTTWVIWKKSRKDCPRSSSPHIFPCYPPQPI